MTILYALAARHKRHATAEDVPDVGFAPAKIHFAIVLSESGEIVDVMEMPRDAKGRIVRELLAPEAPPNRTSAIASGAFWDKTSYVVGRSAPDLTKSVERQARDLKQVAERHAAFKRRHETLLAETDDPGCQALLMFLRQWDPARYDDLQHAAAMLDMNVAFRLADENRFLHDRPAARAALRAESVARAGGDAGLCLVSGQRGPIARLHPSIKNVPGAQSSGASLVSFNQDAFNSYGREQGVNAPVSKAVADAYGSTLNALLTAECGKDEKGRPIWTNRIGLGEDTVVFWAEAPAAEPLMRGFFDPPPPDDRTETSEVRGVLERIATGQPISNATLGTDVATKVYILGLSPNAARLSVRFWLEDTLGALAVRFAEHWSDMRIEPSPRRTQPPVWALLYELAPRRKLDKGLRQLAGEWLRAIVTGSPYPASLLAQALMRARAERTVPGLRVAIIKSVLTRRARKAWQAAQGARSDLVFWKDPWMSLNRDEPHTGYRLGRLFAVLEATQYAGLGRRVGANVRDKYFGSASATPRHVFPMLLKGAQDHLAAAQKRNRGGRASRLDGEIREILDGLPSPGLFPATLDQEAQGAFIVGFYHQDADLRVPRSKNETIDTFDQDDADTDGDEE